MRGGGRREGARPQQLLSKMDAMCPAAAAARASCCCLLLLRGGCGCSPARRRLGPPARTVEGNGWLPAAGAQLKDPAPAAAMSRHSVRRRGAGRPGRRSHWAPRVPAACQVQGGLAPPRTAGPGVPRDGRTLRPRGILGPVAPAAHERWALPGRCRRRVAVCAAAGARGRAIWSDAVRRFGWRSGCSLSV